MSRPARLAAFGGLLVLAMLWSVRPGGEPQLPLDQPAPALRLPSLAGGEVDLGSFRGRLVLLNFWASWCPPCVRETPSLEALHRALSDQGLVVIGVSVDESSRVLRRFVEEHGVTFLVLRDPSGIFAERVYRTVEFPTTYLIDADGIVRERYVGPVEWDAPAALAHLRGRLEAARASPAGAVGVPPPDAAAPSPPAVRPTEPAVRPAEPSVQPLESAAPPSDAPSS